MKVDINCGKCKNAIMLAVAEIEGMVFFNYKKTCYEIRRYIRFVEKLKDLRDLNAGVNQVVLDEEKSLLTVVGTMDPICVVEKLRRIKQKPVVVNIGPPKPPEKKTEPKPVCCKPCPPYCPPYYYNNCDMVTVSTYSNGSGCTIV